MAVTMPTGGMCLVGVAVDWASYFFVRLLFREADRSIDDRHDYQHCE